MEKHFTLHLGEDQKLAVDWKYINKFYQPTTQHQQVVQSINDEKVLDSLLDDVFEHQKSLDQIFSIFIFKNSDFQPRDHMILI